MDNQGKRHTFSDFDVIGLTLPRLLDPAVAIAVSRAGGTGVLDLEWGSGESQWRSRACDAVRHLARFSKGRWGVKLDGEDEATCDAVAGCLVSGIELAILTTAPREVLSRQLGRLASAAHKPGRILLEITSEQHIPDLEGIGGFVAKGHEAGGMVGDETAFILLQRLLKLTQLPVWVQGGIGLHSAGACRVAGAAGVVLDAQLSLTTESVLPEAVRQTIARMDGSETVALGDYSGRAFRCYSHPASSVIKDLRRTAQESDPAAAPERRSKCEIASHLEWGPPDCSLWPLGQDAALGSKLAARFGTAGRVVTAIRESAELHLRLVRAHQSLAEGSALAKSHGTRFPIMQGPMTRVSDNAAFAGAVARGGALPFIALALSTAPETRKVLEETRAALGPHPWGVGILGFVPLAVRAAQLEVIREIKPAFALIAGGRPDQAMDLERAGIATYLHTPSPDLLKLFFEQGSRRFVFEGRECGGHVGPRSSFVLWDAMVEALLAIRSGGADLEGVHVVFAGGIHDALSASMVDALAAPLAEAGAKVGVLLGTAYLFTHEAVSSGAITPAFQEEALRCESTALLESGPGHATRCAHTPFVDLFKAERRRLAAAGNSPDEIRGALEELNLGRLRLASKGVARHPSYNSGAGVPKLVEIDSAGQRANGMYMIGQVAALRRHICSIEELHSEISTGGCSRVSALPAARQVTRTARPCDVAIIGIGALLPKAPNARRFWENILGKVDAITEIPAHRFDWHQYYDPDPAKPDKIYSKWGGFLDDVAFDPVQYGMPPHALASIEPVQLLTLEVVGAAIADAGYSGGMLARARTSVILGAGGGLADLGLQYGMRSGLPALAGDPSRVPPKTLERLPAWTEDSFAGILLNVAAGRVANRFDLGGVNFTVDAACASSLAAIYSAVRELEIGSSDVVIAGGIDTVQNPFAYLCFAKTKALSPRGRCRPFDAGADGIVISEGLAVMVLKRLADAEADGDRIYAVIKSVGGASDGRDKGLTAPRPEGQLAALERAYERAGVNPTTVGLVEAHGTGTVAGDLAELEALNRAFAGSRPQGCAIGSVKSMIGHTKCTAGAAGLVKTAIALREKVLPPTLHVETPNPKIDFSSSPFFVNNEARPWIARPDGVPRRAGVSAFGFGGTNFHVVLEEYRDDPVAARQAPIARSWPSEVFVWAADSPPALRSAVSGLIRALDGGAEPALADLAAATWYSFEDCGAARLAIVASSLADLRAKLASADANLAGGSPNHLTDPRGVYLSRGSARPNPGKIVFLFPGQGSQQVGMLGELAVYFPEVRESFETADRLLADHLPDGLSSYIFPPPEFTDEGRARRRKILSQTEITQPAIGAASWAMWKLLGAMGLRADALAGHSYGEYVALAAAGAFSEPALFALSAARGKCLAEAAEQGAMLAVLEGADCVAEIIGDIEAAWISNYNSPRQTVLSGTQEGISAAKNRLARRGIECRSVPVSCAFHSPLVARAKETLAAVLAATEFSAPRLPVFSNATGGMYPEDTAAAVKLLTDHLVRPVRFIDEIEAMYQYGARTFLEVGPRGTLTGLVGQILADKPHLAVATGGELSSLVHLQQALAQLIVGGAQVSLDRFYRGRVEQRLNCESLLERSRPAETRAGIWLVNGGRARRAGEPAMPPSPVAPLLTAPAATPAKTVPPPALVTAARTTPTPPRAAPEVDDVMVRFQQTMEHFLETQRRTMIAYLGAKATAPAAEIPPPEASHPAPFAANSESVEAPVAVEPAMQARPAELTPTVRIRLREVISERTGYPVEMLKAELKLEADLGIDSIKRVEIMGALQRCFAAPEQEKLRAAMERLTSLKTIGSLDEVLEEVLGTASAAASVEPEAHKELAAAGERPEPLPRFVLGAAPEPATRSGSGKLPDGAFLITDDGGGVAAAVALELRSRGRAAVTLGGIGSQEDAVRAVEEARRTYGRIAGILHLWPLNDGASSWQERLKLETIGLFHLAKAAASDLRAAGETRAVILGATSLGGDFGVSSGGAIPATHGAVVGFLKTLALEWSEVDCKVVDFAPGAPRASVAEQVFAELFETGPVEIGYLEGQRVSLRILPAPLPAEVRAGAVLDGNPVILVTGGARGITAKTVLALASTRRARLVIVGKSPLPGAEEPPETASLGTPRQLKSVLIEQARRRGETPGPAAIESAVSRILQDREIRSNLRALREAGAEVRYCACDLSDAAAFTRLLEEIYSSYGAIHGVIHGAGVIEDRLVEEKDPRSFERVLAAKLTPAMVLAEHLRLESLRFVAFFSSVSGRFGNRGQADYAAANEVLNKLAVQLDARWPARVVALNWGPWDGSNMVPEAIREQFVKRQVQLIDSRAGCAAMLDELFAGKKGAPEVILGGGPWSHPRAAATVRPALPLLDSDPPVAAAGGALQYTLRLDPARHHYLSDHCLDAKPVLPAAMAIELMAEAAQAGWPDSVVSGLKSVRVLKGIVLEGSARTVYVTVRPQTHHSAEDSAMFVDVEIRDPDRPGVAYYRATVCLAKRLPAAAAPPAAMREDGSRRVITVAEAYGSRLFHGARFQCLARIGGLGDSGIVARVKPSSPAGCMEAPRTASWIIDPVLLDAGPQLAILWAQEMRGITVLPSRFGEISLFDGLAGALADASGDLECRLLIDTPAEGPTVTAAFHLLGLDGRPVLSVNGLESTGSEALNRLAVGQSAGVEGGR